MVCPYGVHFDLMSETSRSDYKTLEVYLQIFSSHFVFIKLFFTLPLFNLWSIFGIN